jgi:DNA mismatch repair ATPase MutS
MSGKSTYLRQVAMCCWHKSGVLCRRSPISGIVDRIFTRIAEKDWLQIDFYSEMTETANILNNATLVADYSR